MFNILTTEYVIYLQNITQEKLCYYCAKKINIYMYIEIEVYTWYTFIYQLCIYLQRKCYQYWPKTTGQPNQHKEYVVMCDSVTECADYVVRTLIVTKGVRCNMLCVCVCVSSRNRCYSKSNHITKG